MGRAYRQFGREANVIIGERIERLLLDRGISQAELARRLKLRQSTINALIRGHSQSSKHLHRIARSLGVSAAYLAGETDDPQGEMPEDQLTSDEARLLSIYRQMPKGDRAALTRLIRRMAADTTPGTGK
ncbi:MAG: hypothetical protein QOH47_834 [Sphingomonadales bacterium]|jgi:transcriptional regulator with XRE-family HTH domain|nr:hypothetical protein [Sphingomonadales bacterium]